MKQLIIKFILLFNLTFIILTHAAEPHNGIKFDPKIDESFIADIEISNNDNMLLDVKSWYHLTEEGVGYLRVVYSIKNKSEKTMFGHKWTVKVESEEYNEDVIGVIQPGELKTYSQLVFGGAIQEAGNNENLLNFITTPNFYNPLGVGTNRNNCGVYLPWCNTPSANASVQAASSLCNSKCTMQGSRGRAICVTSTVVINGEKCPVDTIACQCDNGNNPDSILGLPEISRERDLDPFIRTIFQDDSAMDSRPTEIFDF